MQSWLARCEAALAWTGIAAVVAMTCLSTADAASRYLLNYPIPGAYELTEKYLMAAAVFPALAVAYRAGALIRVTFLVDRLPAAARRWAGLLAHASSLVFCGVLAVAGAQQALRVDDNATTLSTLPLPLAPPYWLVPLGFACLALVLLLDTRSAASGRSALFQSEAPPP